MRTLAFTTMQTLLVLGLIAHLDQYLTDGGPWRLALAGLTVVSLLLSVLWERGRT